MQPCKLPLVARGGDVVCRTLLPLVRHYRPASGPPTGVGRYSDSASAIAAANFFRFSGVSRTPRELLSIWRPASGAASRPCRAVLYPPRKNGALGCGLFGLGVDAKPCFSISAPKLFSPRISSA